MAAAALVCLACALSGAAARADSGSSEQSVAPPLPQRGELEARFQAALAAYDRGEFARAYALWLPLAQGGDPAAQRNIGHLYRQGLGVSQDFAAAAGWYRRAADRGMTRAQSNLAMMYLRGQGVEEDAAEAARLFLAAALQGHAPAQYNLGLMYVRGIGVERNEATAAGWFYRAAQSGHQPAIAALAQLVPRLSGPYGPPRPQAPVAAAPGAAPAGGGAEDFGDLGLGTAGAVALAQPGAAGAGPGDAAAASDVAPAAGEAADGDRGSLMRRFWALFSQPDENMGNQIERMSATGSSAAEPPAAAGGQPPSAGPVLDNDTGDGDVTAPVGGLLRRLLGLEDGDSVSSADSASPERQSQGATTE